MSNTCYQSLGDHVIRIRHMGGASEEDQCQDGQKNEECHQDVCKYVKDAQEQALYEGKSFPDLCACSLQLIRNLVYSLT